jgi:hypothetical protein
MKNSGRKHGKPGLLPLFKKQSTQLESKRTFWERMECMAKKYLHSDDSCVKIASNLTECDVL